MNELLSIAIPTYNRSSYLSALLRSINVQFCNDIEDLIQLYIYNNASTDNTETIIQSANLKFRINYLKHPTNILAEPNVFCAYTKPEGKYIWVIGDDELLPPDSLKVVLRLLQIHSPGLLINKTPLYETFMNLNEVYNSYEEFAKLCELSNPHMLLAHSLISSNIVRRDCFDSNFAFEQLNTSYGQFYGMINGLQRAKSKIVIPNQYTLIVRETRAPFEGHFTDLPRKQVAYLSWVADIFQLKSIVPDAIVPEYQRKLFNPEIMSKIQQKRADETRYVREICNKCDSYSPTVDPKSKRCGENAMQIPISFMAMVYNEEHRIRNVLDHAVRWADEVIVVNKSSTDKTKEICLEYGDPVRVVDVPFSPKGHDDIVALSILPGNDWIFFGTASEIPTRKLINRCREILSETDGELDLVYVPRKIFSFGIHSIVSPWSVSYYPFLLNRKKAIITNTIHFNFRPGNPQNTRAIEFSDDCCVYHPTHKSAKDYLKDMTDYFEAEAASCTNPDAKIQECFANIGKFEKQLREAGEPLFGHYLAWPIYWLGTALFVWEKKRGMDVAKFYKNLSDEVIKKEWLEYDDKKSSSPSEDSLKDFKIWQNNRPVISEDDLLLALNGRPVAEKIKVLYLVGAHKFQEKELFLRLFPNLEKIYLFEPIPHLFASLKTMLQDDTRFEVFPYAISDKNESSIFHVTNNEASSSLLPLGKHKEIFPHVDVAQKITVECKKLENAIAQHHLQNPDMLFLDVQGAEYKILSSLSPDMRSKIYLIYTEASKEEVYVGAQTLDRIDALLAPDYIFLGFAPLTNWTPTHGNALFINRRFIDLIKDSTEAKLNRALSMITELCNSGKLEEAKISLKKAIAQFPNSPDLLNLQAVLNHRTGGIEEAKSIFIDLINRWPNFAPAYQNLASIFAENGDIANASKYFDEALKLDKNNREAIHEYGNMLMGNNKYAKAKEVFGNYLNATPNDSEIQALLQKCEGILGKISKLGFVVGKIK